MVIFKGDYLMLIDGINHDFIAQIELIPKWLAVYNFLKLAAVSAKNAVKFWFIQLVASL